MKVAPRSEDLVIETYIEDFEPVKDNTDDKLHALLKNIKPFLVTMKLFGGYFETLKEIKTRNPEEANNNSLLGQRWTFWRVYGTIHLFLSWADVLRYCAAFRPQDAFGPMFLLKINFLGLLLVGSFNRTVSYVACSNGSIQQTLADLSTLDYGVRGVRKLAVGSVVCYVGGLAFGTVIVSYHGLIYKGYAMFNDYQIEPFAMYFTLSSNEVFIANVISILLTVFCVAGSCMPLYFGILVSYVLQQEFKKIKEELETQFQPDPESQTVAEADFEKLRKRHQKLTDILRDVDRFVSMSNGAYILSMISVAILVLYSVSFYTEVYNEIGPLCTYVGYMMAAFIVLAMMSGSAIMLNEAVIHTKYI